MIVTASDKRRPKYKGDTYDMNTTEKLQIVDHFHDENGKQKNARKAGGTIQKIWQKNNDTWTLLLQ